MTEIIRWAPTAFRCKVSGSISLLYSRFFSPFPHGTGSLSVFREYLALDDGPPRFRQGSTCPVLLRNSSRDMKLFWLQGCYLLWPVFPNRSSKITYHLMRLLQPPVSRDWVWATPRSLATTYGISIDFFSYGYLDGSVPRVRLHKLCIHLWITEHYLCWVSPFGDSGVKNCMRLVRNYRS